MDSIAFFQRETCQGPTCFAVVCDGVGSTHDGGFAAKYCTQTLLTWFRNAPGERIALALRDQVLALNESLLQKARAETMDTATTLSALLLTPGRYATVHIGDSRIYHWGEGVLTQLTQDDSSSRGRLTGCVGRWGEIMPHYDEGPAAAGCYLLCSDGLYKRAEPGQMERILARGTGWRQKWALKQLIRRAVDAGVTDNISAILIEEKK